MQLSNGVERERETEPRVVCANFSRAPSLHSATLHANSTSECPHLESALCNSAISFCASFVPPVFYVYCSTPHAPSISRKHFPRPSYDRGGTPYFQSPFADVYHATTCIVASPSTPSVRSVLVSVTIVHTHSHTHPTHRPAPIFEP